MLFGRMSRFLLSGLCLLTACAQASAAPKTIAGMPKADAVGLTATAPRTMYLRNAFDTDPSLYLGRFVPDGTEAAALDESRGMQTQCSRYITYKAVGGGGVTYDELYNASTSAGISAQIPSVGSVGVGASFGQTVRVKYTVDQKLISYIADPDKFAACCTRAPDQCPAEYIGEFISGAGAVYYTVGRDLGANLDIKPGGIDLDFLPKIEVKNGVSWNRGIVFPQPVYFGFKLYPNPHAGPDWDCATETVPSSAQGYYFVGVSSVMIDEAQARDDAMLNARKQVVQFIGEQIQSGEASVSSSGSDIGGLATNLASESWVQGAASGVASLVQTRKTCVEKLPMPTGYQYKAKALAYVPNASVDVAAAALVAPAGTPVPPTAPPNAEPAPGGAPAGQPPPGTPVAPGETPASGKAPVPPATPPEKPNGGAPTGGGKK